MDMDAITVSDIPIPPNLHLNDPNWDGPDSLPSPETDIESVGGSSVEKGDSISISGASSKSYGYDLFVRIASLLFWVLTSRC